jgi:hypothetical protein
MKLLYYNIKNIIIKKMAGNTNNGYRKGSVKERSQIYNPKTEQYIKRDTTTGKFIASSNTKFKGVRKEKTVITVARAS